MLRLRQITSSHLRHDFSDRAGGSPALSNIRGDNESMTVNQDGGGRLEVISNDATMGLNLNGYVL